VPSSTDARIEEIIAKIRNLWGGPFSGEAEAELRKLARELRSAIKQHVRMAKSSLGVKGAAIRDHDPDTDTR
jgi:predicted SpoU family rRNA methylase